MPKRLALLANNLPEEIKGWHKASQNIYYNPKNLYDYLDGAAELYRSYAFNLLLVQKYSKPGYPDITIDIFDMYNSYNAFGIFSQSRETTDTSIGQGTEYTKGLLIFWRNNFYVSLLAYPETEEKKELVFTLAQNIASSIKEDGPLPPIISALPQEHLMAESVLYFHHYQWANQYHFITEKNILNINQNSPAVLAKYQTQSKPFIVLLVLYPDPHAAKQAQENFITHYLSGTAKGIKQMAPNSWAGCQVFNKLLVIILNTAKSEKIISFYHQLKSNR